MPENVNAQVPSTTQSPVQTETPQPRVQTEISALANYRAAREAQASSAKPQTSETSGQPQPNVGQQESEREQYIPRNRFDEVLAQRNALQQQLSQFQQMQQQRQPQAVGPTGMVQQQQPTPQQQQQAVTSFIETVTKDPKQRQEWQRRIANEGIPALAEFMVKVVEDRGRPLLEEYTRTINQQLTPIQRQFINQQVNGFMSQRQNDPDFAIARPYFTQLVATATQRGYDVTNPQVLGTLEFLAKQQASQLAQQGQPMQQQHQMPQPMPFTERPGSGQALPRPTTRQLTPQEAEMARRFNLTAEQYIDSLRAMGVE